MIRINLLGEKLDKSGLYFLQVLGYFAAVLTVLAGCFVVLGGLNDEVETLEQEKQLLESKLAKLKRKTKEVQGLEEKKQLLKEKLMTISSLKAKKTGPVQLLDDLNNAIPERAWLLEVEDSGGTLELIGVALDNQTVSDFMESLDSSKFFKEIDLKYSSQIIQDNVKLQNFSISTKLVSLLDLQREEDAKKKSEAAKEGDKGSEDKKS